MIYEILEDWVNSFIFQLMNIHDNNDDQFDKKYEAEEVLSLFSHFILKPIDFQKKKLITSQVNFQKKFTIFNFLKLLKYWKINNLPLSNLYNYIESFLESYKLAIPLCETIIDYEENIIIFPHYLYLLIIQSYLKEIKLLNKEENKFIPEEQLWIGIKENLSKDKAKYKNIALPVISIQDKFSKNEVLFLKFNDKK